MAPMKRSHKGKGESRQGDDETREEIAPEAAVEATQGEEGGPSKKTRALRKKVVAPSKTASQLREELNLEPIRNELNQEQGVVNQAVGVEDQPNAPLDESEGVESEEPKKDSDREGPRRRETPMAKLKDEFREMRATMAMLIDQNQMLVEIIRSKINTSSDATKPTYMKNVLKPTMWDTRDKRNIKAFFTEYETYCDASGYNGDEVKVRSFGSFLWMAHSSPLRRGGARTAKTSRGRRLRNGRLRRGGSHNNTYSTSRHLAQ